ncbi:MAG TPA: Gfo/Idh/MocA family oxidoreductase [Planctomycetaceae bacterium]|nr:Gfo/Idh/MocA family oxidoreductase [Planctomycetaceae bacterium]
MRDGKLGVAIHGAGWVASAHVLSWKKNPHVQLVSVSDVDLERAMQFARRNGLTCAVRGRYEEVLADPGVDIVDITSPSHVHAQQGIAAAEAGKHVLVEKPIALTMEENRALRDAVAGAGVKSITSFVARFNPEMQTLKSLIQSGAIGDLFYAEVDYWHAIRPTHHAWHLHSKRETGGSSMLLGGCHAVDALRWLADDEVTEVVALSNNWKGLFEYDANVVAILRFDGGVIAKTSALFDCEMPYTFNIDLVGTHGTLRDNRVWSRRLFPGQTGWSRFPTIMMDSADVMHHCFDEEINYFVDCIREDRRPHCDIADGYRSHEVCMAIDRSLETGAPVRLPLAS